MTEYTETNALIAVMEDDEDEAVRLLDSMLPMERRTFDDQLAKLRRLTSGYGFCDECRLPIKVLTDSVTEFVTQLSFHRACRESRRQR